jgi:CHAD domain-containing protein
LRSVYFDTPSHNLHVNGISLQVQRVARKCIQIASLEANIRVAGSDAAAFASDIEGDRPRIDLIEGPLAEQVRDLVGDAALQPLFEINTCRSKHLLELPTRGKIKLVLEESRVITEAGLGELRGVRLKPTPGDVGTLASVAETILGGIGFRIRTESMAASAFRLLRSDDAQEPSPEKSVAVPLTPHRGAAEAFTAICRSATRQILRNWRVVLESADPEGPHQLRIGLRRLRTALRVFRPAFDNDALRQLASDLRDFAKLVGEVRDLDVQAAEIVAPVASRVPERPGFQALQKLLARRVKQRRMWLQRELDAPRWSSLQIRLALLPDGAGWAELAATEPASQRVGLLAALALDECWKRAKRYARRLDKLSIDDRHELRKRLKALRYAAEFFLPLYPEAQSGRFLKRLRQLLDLFGYMNDVAMAEMLLDLSRAETAPDRDRDMAAGFVLGWHSARAEKAWEDVSARWNQLERAERFWR